MKVLAVIHSDEAGPELFTEVLAEDGHELVVWDIRTKGSPPQDVDAVMVFGGDQNVGEEELREWVPALRQLSDEANEAYAFFNNNNQTNGVAQAPAGAYLLRKLLEEENVPTA